MSPQPQAEDPVERAVWADREGYDDIWFPDGYGTAAVSYTHLTLPTSPHV